MSNHDEQAAGGWTEPDDAGDDDGVPAELVEAHEALDFQAALDRQAKRL